MKKFMVLAMAVVMVAGFLGTAGAADSTRTLSNANTLFFFASPVAETGVSTYLLAGGPTTGQTSSGATLIMINPATGASSFWGGAALFPAGTSAYGTPAVISGETVFFQVKNTRNETSGTSIVAINGETGGTYYAVSIPRGLDGGINAAGFPGPITGATPYTAPLTIDPAGTKIYGVSGVSAAGTSGASIWSLTIATGAVSSFATGVSSIWAAPLVSGNSLYIVGVLQEGAGAAGVSLIAFNKADGILAARTRVLGSSGATPFATPAISGNSIFVVDATGGLTAYNKNTLAVGAQDFIQFGQAAESSVTASPVTDGSFLVVTQNNTSGRAGVTVFALTAPLGNSGTSWFFAFPTGTTITATPAISNGVVYVAANSTSSGGFIQRFNLSGKTGRVTNQEVDFPTIIRDSNGSLLGFFDFSSPIIKGSTLQIVSNGGTGAAGSATANRPVLYTFDSVANGNNFWQQFKADAERTGNNTAAAAVVTPAAGDSDSGCFISTIK